MRRFSRSQLPDAVLETVSNWIETGDYDGERETELELVHHAEVHELIDLCKAIGIHARVDARSARDGYSGLSWQVDCKTSKGWLEMAGGGDYSDAAILTARLQNERDYDPTTIVAGSAAGVDRAFALKRETAEH